MKKVLALGLVLVCASMASAGNANITGYMCGPDSDGAICERSNASVSGVGTSDVLMTLYVSQNSRPAHMQGSFTADSELDPSVYLVEEVMNDMNFDWTGYEFYVWMSKPFTISNVVAPTGWTYSDPTVVAGVANPNSDPENPVYGWLGTVIYDVGSGSAISQNNGIGEFGMKLKFDGSINFCTEQVPVPEPLTLAMLAMGGVAVIRRR